VFGDLGWVCFGLWVMIGDLGVLSVIMGGCADLGFVVVKVGLDVYCVEYYGLGGL